MNLTWHKAGVEDLPLLARWNYSLIRDEGHRNQMTVDELTERMKIWLAGEYEAVIFSDHEPVAYALYRKGSESIYLRQFFVVSDKRRNGVGRHAIETLKSQIWPTNTRLTVDVLSQNERGLSFWRNAGYQDYCVTLEIMPKK